MTLHNCMSVIDNENGFEGAFVDKKNHIKIIFISKASTNSLQIKTSQT